MTELVTTWSSTRGPKPALKYGLTYPDALVDAMRVPASMPKGEFGIWLVTHVRVGESSPERERRIAEANQLAPYSDYTVLRRATMSTIHLGPAAGDIVMEDSPRELRKHLPFMLAARGRVLVTGLGLGCVVRGLLAKSEVTALDVVEIDPTIRALVGPEFTGDPRFTLYAGDARTWLYGELPRPHRQPALRWDYAWHDLWNDDSEDTPHLMVTHADVLGRYHFSVDHQGAWEFPRLAKRLWPVPLIGGKRRRWRTHMGGTT